MRCCTLFAAVLEAAGSAVATAARQRELRSLRAILGGGRGGRGGHVPAADEGTAQAAGCVLRQLRLTRAASRAAEFNSWAKRWNGRVHKRRSHPYY